MRADQALKSYWHALMHIGTDPLQCHFGMPNMTLCRRSVEVHSSLTYTDPASPLLSALPFLQASRMAAVQGQS